MCLSTVLLGSGFRVEVVCPPTLLPETKSRRGWFGWGPRRDVVDLSFTKKVWRHTVFPAYQVMDGAAQASKTTHRRG